LFSSAATYATATTYQLFFAYVGLASFAGFVAAWLVAGRRETGLT